METAGVDLVLMGRLDRLIEATERSAKAQEDLIKLAEDERVLTAAEELVAHCPHCGKADPPIKGTNEGEDRLSGFVLITECQNCGKEFFGFAHSWQLVGTREEALAFQAERRGSEHS